MGQSNNFKAKLSLFFVLLILIVVVVAVISADSNKVLSNASTISVVQTEKSRKLVDFGSNENVVLEYQEAIAAKETAIYNLQKPPVEPDPGNVDPGKGGVTYSCGYGWSD